MMSTWATYTRVMCLTFLRKARYLAHTVWVLLAFVSFSKAFRVLYVSFSGVRGVVWHMGFVRRGWKLWGVG